QRGQQHPRRRARIPGRGGARGRQDARPGVRLGGGQPGPDRAQARRHRRRGRAQGRRRGRRGRAPLAAGAGDVEQAVLADAGGGFENGAARRLRRGQLGERGGQVGAHQRGLLRGQVQLLVLQEIVGGGEAVERGSVEDALRAELVEGRVELGDRILGAGGI